MTLETSLLNFERTGRELVSALDSFRAEVLEVFEVVGMD